MSDNKTKKELLDDFWDISSLVPQGKPLRPSSKSVSTVEITDGVGNAESAENRLTEQSTVIRRFIPPHSSSELVPKREPELSYIPESSLIHKVTLYKEKTSYEFYAVFCATARKLWSVSGEECEYVDFFSYSPQYDQLSRAQLAYYLWWRDNLRQGRYIKTNTCYIYLYTFELINACDMTTPEEARERMISVLENYGGILRGVIPRYIRWISDFSLIHRLPPPRRFSEQLLKNAGAFKEYFVRVPGNTPDGWARTLLAYCCSYDYRTSKFTTGDSLALYDTHVPRALTKAVEYLSGSGRILSDLPFGDCHISAKAFEGAVCSSANRYTIEAEYCSFSRSHELRFLVGDIVKYCENKIRAHIFVKSRLTVYSLPNELRDVIDAYFADALPPRPRATQKKEETHEYDVLYDLPQTKLDLSNAGKIELESWQTTKELVEAFDEPDAVTSEPITTVPEQADTDTDDTTLVGALGDYASAVISLSSGDSAPLYALSRALGKPVEAVVDIINGIAVDVMGDILLEDNGDGFAVIEDYADMLG